MSSSLEVSTPDQAFITICGACGERVALPKDQLAQAKQQLSVTCTCGHVTNMARGRRRFKRKVVELSGKIFDRSTHECLARVTVVDVSLTGVGLIAEDIDIDVGRTFILAFRLDDEFQTMIQEIIVVRNLRPPNRAGAEFTSSKSNSYNFHLDFYITPWAELL